MQTVLESTNTVGGIGMSKNAWVEEAEERGYREALLDVYCVLTGNEQILDYPARWAIIEKMLAQVSEKANRLIPID